MSLIFKIPKYQLYLLQLENYELGRYLRLLFKKGLWPKPGQRKDLVWTMKAKAVFCGGIVLFLLLPVIFWVQFFGGVSELGMKNYELGILLLASFLILYSLFFILYAITIVLLWPADYLIKLVMIERAQAKIRNSKNLKVIGIAGSYGKTTMKEVLNAVLSAKFKVLSTPESVNTPVGIARWVLKEFPQNTLTPRPPLPKPPQNFSSFGEPRSRGEGESDMVIVLVEMGEHYQGDIESLCKLAPPDIAVVTGINEAHLERLKNLQTTTQTIFEIVSGTKPGGMVVLNGDDARVMEHYKEYVWKDHHIEKFKIEDLRLKIFEADRLLWAGEYEGLGRVSVKLLGEYGLGDVSAAIKIAKSLGMNGEEIMRGIENIRPIEHRLQPAFAPGNILVIDDAYNGNLDGVAEAIRVLSRFEGRRKVYITPGLVEVGKAAKDVHLQIGHDLAKVADVVILIKNSVTGWIAEALASTLQSLSPGDGERRREVEKENQPLPNPLHFLERETKRNVALYWFDTAPEAHAALKTILKPGDVVVFQNDWGDQYL